MNEMREQMSWRHRNRRKRLASLREADEGDMNTSEAMEKLAEIAVGLALGFMLEGTGLMASDEAQGGERSAATAYDSLAWKDTVTQLHLELANLPDREQTILREHYLAGVNFDQLAALLAISKGRVSQLHRAALELLRKRIGERNRFLVIR
jgi:RNA polymerase sigma factor for flagellar operon FliA